MCMRITVVFSTIPSSSMLCLVGIRGSSHYSLCLVQNWDLGRCILQKPLLWRSCSSKRLRGSLSKEGNNPALKCRWCLRMFSLCWWVQHLLHIIILCFYDCDVSRAHSVKMPWLPLGLDPVQFLFRWRSRKHPSPHCSGYCRSCTSSEQQESWNRGRFSYCQDLHPHDWPWLS